VKRRQQCLSPDVLSDAAALYEQGWSLDRIGHKFGCDAETMVRTFQRRGIPMRPRNGWKSEECHT
jgi:hypothetical protein